MKKGNRVVAEIKRKMNTQKLKYEKMKVQSKRITALDFFNFAIANFGILVAVIEAEFYFVRFDKFENLTLNRKMVMKCRMDLLLSEHL